MFHIYVVSQRYVDLESQLQYTTSGHIIYGEYHCISSVHTNKASMLNNRGIESLDAMQQTSTLRSESPDLVNIALLMKKESSF